MIITLEQGLQWIAEMREKQILMDEKLNLIANHQPVNEAPIDRKELGVRLDLSEPTIIRMDKRGELGGFNVGGQRRYIWSVVLANLSSGKQKTSLNKKGGRHV